MLSEELQKLIDASLTDGVLTDKERAVIRKRALLEGIDPEEVDLLLDSEVQKMQQKQQETVAKVRKCPNCGEIISTMTSVCPSCGYQFEKESNKVAVRFAKGLENLKGRSLLNMTNERANYIKNFAIPNSAEDLFDLTLFFRSATKATDNTEEANAYKSKFLECRERITMLFPDDPKFQTLLEKTKINWWQRQSKKTKILLCVVLYFIISAIICIIL